MQIKSASLPRWQKFDSDTVPANGSGEDAKGVNHGASVTANAKAALDSLKLWKAFDVKPDGFLGLPVVRQGMGVIIATFMVLDSAKSVAIDVPIHAAFYGAEKLFSKE